MIQVGDVVKNPSDFAFRIGVIRAAKFFVLGLLGFLGACSGHMYTSNATREIPVSELKVPANLQPVFFEFEFLVMDTDFKPDPVAKAFYRQQVLDQVRQSGLFSTVLETRSTGVSRLNVTVTESILTYDSVHKGRFRSEKVGDLLTTASSFYAGIPNDVRAHSANKIVASSLRNYEASAAEALNRQVVRVLVSDVLYQFSQAAIPD